MTDKLPSPETPPAAVGRALSEGLGRCAPTYELVYDVELRAPACVLLQAALGCGASPPMLRHFEPRHWITHPTPGMRKMTGTDAEWRRVAEVTVKRWGAEPVSAA